MSTIRVFIGCSANGEDLESQAVLEYTLRKHHPGDDLDITWMKLSRDPASFWHSDMEAGAGWNTEGWATPFSALRWGIPAACGFEGRAIYVDSDMIAMADIGDLWAQEISARGAAILAKDTGKSLCVMLMDCARMRHHLPPIERLKREAGLYRKVRHQIARSGSIVQRFAGNWNCLDGEHYQRLDDPEIKILHYTSIPEQPHLRHAIPRLAAEGRAHWYDGRSGAPRDHRRRDMIELFDRLLAEAAASGYPISRYVPLEMFGDYGWGAEKAAA